MDRPRLAGGTSLTSTPSISIRPPFTSSRPAISRSNVDLPQPDGPTKTTNSPPSISRSTEGMIVTSPNDLLTPRRTILPLMPKLPEYRSSFDRSERKAAHKLPLGKPPEYQDGRYRHGRRRRQLGPEQPLRTRIGGDEGRQRRRLRGGRVQRPHRLVPREDEVEQQGRCDARQGHERQHVDDLPPQGRPVHARRLQDLAGYLLEVGEVHPDDDRQVEQEQHRDQPASRVEEAEVLEDEIDRNQRPDGRHHLRRQHPHQQVLGPPAR